MEIAHEREGYAVLLILVRILVVQIFVRGDSATNHHKTTATFAHIRPEFLPIWKASTISSLFDKSKATLARHFVHGGLWPIRPYTSS